MACLRTTQFTSNMRLLIVLGIIASSLAVPQGRYTAPAISNVGGAEAVIAVGGVSCGPDQIQHADGSCVDPVINRNLYIYAAPDIPVQTGPVPVIPKPQIDYNIIFVRTPEAPEALEPVVVPPPQQKTLVYVLTKGGQATQKVIEVPAGPAQAPEVYYINYNDGDNPQLIAGLDLQSALSSATSGVGQLIGGGGAAVGGLEAGIGLGGGVVNGAKGGYGSK